MNSKKKAKSPKKLKPPKRILDKYDKLKVSEIKDLLRSYNARLEGKKADLLVRLKFYEANFRKKPGADPLPSYEMTVPEYQIYKDLNSGVKDAFPPITFKSLEDYLNLFEKRFDEKCKDMYNERYLRNVRAVQDETSLWFVSSMVWAEMRKDISYVVDLCLDKFAKVREAQCDCSAGQAPDAHCKHIAIVLYGLTRFKKSGEILTELTCTQELQTFHKAKAYTGSPMKCSTLAEVRHQRCPLYDPRPEKFVKMASYPDYFRNTCFHYNYSKGYKRQMPVMQLIEPANPHAHAMDHDYFQEHPEVRFLRMQQISIITEEQAAEIERQTRGQADSEEWMGERKKRITSSKFGEICKAETRDMHHLALSLTKSVRLRAPAIIHGRKYESVAVSKYESQNNAKTEECGLYVSTKTPFLAATPDRKKTDRLLEIKCPYSARGKMISPDTVDYLEEINGHLILKQNHAYYYQVQGQLYCTGYNICDFVVYTFEDLKVIHIMKDQPFIDEMVEKLTTFYVDYFRDVVVHRFLYNSYYDHSF